MVKQRKTSWESSSKWYDNSVGQQGHYYHENIILPKLFKLLDLKGAKVLDLGCGQGILARNLPEKVPYVGVDLSQSLLQAAKGRSKNPLHTFHFADLSKNLVLKEKDFTHAFFILSLQNIENTTLALENATNHLKEGGKLIFVLNHPCFRIPRQTHWGVDEPKKLQYRRIDSYLSSQKIPIQMHPGQKEGAKTWSFHHPLSSYINWLHGLNCSVIGMEEWSSNKKSTGGRAKMENRARKEIPLFLTLIAQKGRI